MCLTETVPELDRTGAPLRIGWIGFHREGLEALEAVAESPHDVAGVVTLRPDKAMHRSGSVDYATLCRQHDIRMFEVDHINDNEAVGILEALDMDLGIVLGWNQILSRRALMSARLGMVGAHASLLPHNRGSAPVNWSIIRGEAQSGNSLMWLDPEVDAGEIIDQRSFDITRYDTCRTIYEKVAISNRDMVIELLTELQSGKRPGAPQPPCSDELLPRRRPKDGCIDWDQPAAQIYNFIRGITRPYPGAFAYMGDERFIIWHTALLPSSFGSARQTSGTILDSVCSPVDAACGQLVACRQGALLILEVEDTEGRVYKGQALSSLDWANRRFANDCGVT